MAGEPIAGARGAVTRGPRAEALYDAVVQGEPVRVVELRADANPASARPAALVRVAETEVKRKELAREILLSVIVPQVLLILDCRASSSGSVSRAACRRCGACSSAVESRSPHDRSPVALTDVPAEVRPLLHSINGLLERLDSLLTLQSRFIADAAHQLKTPVAALQAQVELASRQQDPEHMRESMRAAAGRTRRGCRGSFRNCCRSRATSPRRSSRCTLVPLDLNALALEVASSWVPEALSKGIDLGFEGCAVRR